MLEQAGNGRGSMRAGGNEWYRVRGNAPFRSMVVGNAGRETAAKQSFTAACGVCIRI